MKDTQPQENHFQIDFIGRLKGMLPAHISLADELIDILDISQDSAYRRIRGETAMSVDEAITLCNHYKIPIAHFTDEIKGLVNFKYVAPDGTKASFHKHIEMIFKSSDELLNHEDRRIQYSAIDTPLFLQFAFEPLARFKMHFWMREIEGIQDFKAHYDPNDIDRELVALSHKIHEVYLNVPSDEIWTDDIMHTTLKQLQYYFDADYFKNKEHLEEILAQLDHLIDLTENMATINRKLKFGDKLKQPYQEFNLYQSDVLLGNNTVLTFGGGKITSYISHMTFSILSTNSARYAAETATWMKSILNKSNLISGVSEKNRSKYFRHLRKTVAEARDKMLG